MSDVYLVVELNGWSQDVQDESSYNAKVLPLDSSTALTYIRLLFSCLSVRSHLTLILILFDFMKDVSCQESSWPDARQGQSSHTGNIPSRHHSFHTLFNSSEAQIYEVAVLFNEYL